MPYDRKCQTPANDKGFKMPQACTCEMYINAKRMNMMVCQWRMLCLNSPMDIKMCKFQPCKII